MILNLKSYAFTRPVIDRIGRFLYRNYTGSGTHNTLWELTDVNGVAYNAIYTANNGGKVLWSTYNYSGWSGHVGTDDTPASVNDYICGNELSNVTVVLSPTITASTDASNPTVGVDDDGHGFFEFPITFSVYNTSGADITISEFTFDSEVYKTTTNTYIRFTMFRCTFDPVTIPDSMSETFNIVVKVTL